MKKIKLLAMGVVLILLLGILSACGQQGAEHTAPPEETPSVSVAPTPDPEPVQTPTPEPEPSPEPTKPPYDVFSDPNVLWGEELDIPPLLESALYRVTFSLRLEELLQQVNEDTLIVFHVTGHRDSAYFTTIPPEGMNIPEELDQDGELTALVSEYNCAETQEDRGAIYYRIFAFLRSNPYGYPSSISREIDQFPLKTRYEIYDEWGLNPAELSWDEEAAVRKEIKSRLSESEEYKELQRLLEAAYAWEDISVLFRRQFEEFYIEEVRSAIMGAGLLSIYPSIAETPRPSFAQQEFFGTFVGTAKEIKCLESVITDNGGFTFLLAVKPQR